MTDEKLSPKEYLREHDADGNATIRHTHDPASGLDAEPDFDNAQHEIRWLKDQVAHGTRIQEFLRAELQQVDAVLARRPALDGEPTRAAKIEKAISVAKEADGLRELIATLNGKLDNLLTQRCGKCGTTIPGDEVLRQRIVDLEWAEVKAKKLEAELARMRARLGDMTEELGEQVGRQEALEVLGEGSKP